LVEDYVRKSIFHSVIGVFTLIWILCTVWTFVIVIGWTFIPGVAAFHASAQATAGDAFCGTWMTVFTARLCSVLGLLFLLVNMITVARWIMDMMIHSAAFEKNLLRQAKNTDDQAGGVPVCQILAKALVLRGSSDTVYAEMNVCTNENIFLRRQKQKVEAELSELDTRITHYDTKIQGYQQKIDKQGGDSGFAGIISNLESPGSSSEWRERGIAAVQAAEARAMPAAEEEAKDLDKFVKRIQDVVESIMDSDEFKQAQQAGIEAAEAAEKKAIELAEQAQEAAIAAAAAVEEGAKQAYKAAEDKLNDPETQRMIAEAKAKGQELAEKGMEKGKELAEQGVEKGKELAEQGQKLAEEGIEKGKEVVEKVKEKVEEIDVEELKKQGADAAEQASKAVEDVADKAKKATKKK